jgi:hypothetical protein
MPTASTTGTPGRAPVADDEDFDEPPIPEYLIAERRQRDGAGPAAAGRPTSPRWSASGTGEAAAVAASTAIPT